LSLVKGSFKYLSAHQVALKFNFNDPQVTLPSSEVVTLPIDEDGRIDALMMWFELHLDDEISFNTLPSSNNSWEQALYPSHDDTINVTKGTNIPVNTSCTDAAISLNISTDNSIPPPSSVIHYIESSELASLNDVTYIDTICQSLDELLQCDASWYVLDITSLPLISLLSSKHIEYIMIANVRSYYRPLVDHIISHNQLNHKTSIASIQSISAMTWDIVLYDPITPQGTLDTPSILLLNQISNDTISLCERVQIHITGINSPALRARSCVLGTIPTLGLEIAPFINKYQVTHYADIDLSTFPYKAITEVLTLDISPLNQELSIESSVPVTITDSLTGLAYWFTLCYYGNRTISTGPNGYPEVGGHHVTMTIT
jgi:type II protein arginine methyltransferase